MIDKPKRIEDIVEPFLEKLLKEGICIDFLDTEEGQQIVDQMAKEMADCIDTEIIEDLING